MHFFLAVSESPTAISLPKTVLLSHPREIQKMSFNLFIRVAAIAVLSMHFFLDFTAEQSHLRYVWLLSAKILQHAQVIYFVIRCEAKFSKVRLEIFKCT